MHREHFYELGDLSSSSSFVCQWEVQRDYMKWVNLTAGALRRYSQPMSLQISRDERCVLMQLNVDSGIKRQSLSFNNSQWPYWFPSDFLTPSGRSLFISGSKFPLALKDQLGICWKTTLRWLDIIDANFARDSLKITRRTFNGDEGVGLILKR